MICRDHQVKRALLHEVGTHIAAGLITADEIRQLAPAEHPYRASARQLQTYAEDVAAVVLAAADRTPEKNAPIEGS